MRGCAEEGGFCGRRWVEIFHSHIQLSLLPANKLLSMGIIAHDFLDSNMVYIMRKHRLITWNFGCGVKPKPSYFCLPRLNAGLMWLHNEWHYESETNGAIKAVWSGMWKEVVRWGFSGTALGRYFSNAFSATLRFRVQSTIYEHQFALSNLLGSLLEREQTLPKSEYFRCDRMWKT